MGAVNCYFMQKTKSKLLCRSCDLVVQVPPYRKGYRCVCPQCKSQLRSGSKVSMHDLAVVSIASVILLFTSLTLPFLSISSMGISQSMSLTSIFFILRRDWAILLYICILFTFLCPLVMHSIVIAIVFFKLKVTRTIANVYMFCHRFCMVDVFIVGVLVSLVKLVSLAQVNFHVGFYTAIVFAFLMVWCYSRGSPYKIWNLIAKQDSELKYAHIGMRGIDQGLIMCRHCGMVIRRKNRKNQEQIRNLSYDDPRYAYQGEEVCPRCGHHNDYRATACYQKTIALLLAAIIIYVPSNIYPIMVTTYLGNSIGSNIIDGVISLWGMGSFFVAGVVFVASICIPVIKIICISWLLYVSRYGFKKSPAVYNRLYRVVLFIGRWSMIDVFVVIIMSTIVRMSGLLTISPGMAVICFSMVVLITMLAAEEFDERLLWDRTLSARHGSVAQYNASRPHSPEEDMPAAATAASAATNAAANKSRTDSATDTAAEAAAADAEAAATAEVYNVVHTTEMLQRLKAQAQANKAKAAESKADNVVAASVAASGAATATATDKAES